jgi:hypothetical protein
VPLALIDAAAIIEVYAQVNIISPYYLWTVPAWVGWYLYATGKRRGTAKPAESTPKTVATE